MKRIIIFGTGNVAIHLWKALIKAENFKVIQVYNHQQKSLDYFKNKIPTTTSLSEILPADIYILAVRDESIPLMAKKLINSEAFVVHTSGSTPLSVFDGIKKSGVFYPLQTFSRNKTVDFKNIPICIEAGEEQHLKILEQLANELSQRVYKISSAQRKSLHVAAVFVSNFVNLLYTQGEEICKQNNIPFDILHPLILETASKITNMSPMEAQTGPAKRGDQDVVDTHLSQINEDQKKLYTLLTQSIQQLHGKKL